MRILPSRHYDDKAQCLAVVKALVDGTEIDPHDLYINLSDNIGYIIKGDQASYDQWNVILNIIVKAKQLIKDGISCRDPNKRLSRIATHDWDVLCSIDMETNDGSLARKVVGVRKEDKVALSCCVLESIRLEIENYIHGRLYVGACIPNAARIIDFKTRSAIERPPQWIDDDNDGIVVLPNQLPRIGIPQVDEIPPTSITSRLL